MNKIVFVLFLFLGIHSNCFADMISLIENRKTAKAPEENRSIDPAGNDEDEDQSFADLTEFVKTENERIRIIKLLNLDLEKAQLELKKKEIEQKINQLGKSEEATIISGNIPNSQKTSLDLLGVFEVGENREAMININGNTKRLKEGDVIDGGFVKRINAKSVTIQFGNGIIKEVYL